MVRYLINTSRSLIFSTAPSPPAVAGALAALELLQDRPHRVDRLRSNARAMRRALAAEGFPVDESEMPIAPLIVGDARAASGLCQAALERGVFAQAIRPPTVPSGTSRLRLAAMASHTHSELQLAAAALGESARAIGIDPAQLEPAPPERVPSYDPYEDEQVHVGVAPDGLFDAPFDVERDGDLPDGPVSPEQRERWLAAARPREADGQREQRPPEPALDGGEPFDGDAAPAPTRAPYDHARAA
jgi:glycine C-acetyltransferase/8-amino-7-oxononanoate synthase